MFWQHQLFQQQWNGYFHCRQRKEKEIDQVVYIDKENQGILLYLVEICWYIRNLLVHKADLRDVLVSTCTYEICCKHEANYEM